MHAIFFADLVRPSFAVMHLAVQFDAGAPSVFTKFHISKLCSGALNIESTLLCFVVDIVDSAA